MTLQTYENLDVYQEAFEDALIIHKLTGQFPKDELYGGIAGQMRRSSKSICANIAEGFAKQMSAADKKRYLSIAIGSAEETRVWLAFSARLNYMSEQQAQELSAHYLTIAKKLYKLGQTIKF